MGYSVMHSLSSVARGILSAIFSFDCHISGVHAGGFMKGISGCQDEGAYSIVLSGGYEDDIDVGETLCESFVIVANISGSFTSCAVHTLDQVGAVFLGQTLCITSFPYLTGGRDKSVRSAILTANRTACSHTHTLLVTRWASEM